MQLFDWKKLRSIFSIQKRYLKFPVFIYDNHTDFCYGYSSAKCIHVYLEKVHVNIQVLYLFQFKHSSHLLCGIAFLRVLSLFLNKEIVKGLKLGDQLQSLLYIIELFQVFFSFSYNVKPSQTTKEYSRTGLIHVVYNLTAFTFKS